MEKQIISREQAFNYIRPLGKGIQKLHKALASSDLPIEDADDIREDLQQIHLSYQFASMFTEDSVCTIAGLQGVGKSTLANIMFEIPKEAELVSGRGSCEHIPILLKNVASKSEELVKIFSSNKGHIIEESLSYDEARERVINNNKYDLFAIWNIYGSKKLEQMSPVVVLPGIQESASFNSSIEVAIANSDVVIIATTHSRAAQIGLNTIDNWRSEYKVPNSKTAFVGTFVDVLSDDKKSDFYAKLEDYGSEIFMISNDLESNKGDHSHDDLFVWAVEKMTKSAIMFPGMKKIAKDTRTVIRKIDKAISEIKIENTSHTQLEVIGHLEKQYNQQFSYLSKHMIKTFSKSIYKLRDDLIETLDDEISKNITGGAKNQIDLFFSKNTPEGKKLRDLAIKLKKSFLDADFLNIIYEETLQVLVNQLENSELTDNNFDSASVLQTFIAGIFINSLSDDFDKKIPAGKSKSVNEMTESISDKLKNTKTILNNFKVEIESKDKKSKEQKETVSLGEALFNLTPIGEGAGNVTKILFGAGGAAATTAELAGAGFAGISASVLAGVIGGAVLLMASHSLISSYRVGQRELDNSLHSHFKSYLEYIAENSIIQFTKDLEDLGEKVWYCLEIDLKNRFGVTAKNSSIITLLETSAELKEAHKQFLSYSL
ncbi:hypothetical protein EW093_00950 [Thiospirochaeta perfilievii]|uniref:Uncharacterized protein n=1 Tax=Thiospirochaeta perfilievii TaxID=252967 RepID=A0A5C1Q8G3_9SPIO|nr:hypothetical protein [Thiospirochaeta perfilievii]QEN03330.1 hypothetical protein EW093_00950 [Thiospirochaeta perfilievii]